MSVTDAREWAHRRAVTHADEPWEVPAGSNHVPDAWPAYGRIFDAPVYDAPWCGVELLLVIHHGGLDMPANWISVLLAQHWAEEHSRWSRGSAGTRAGDALVIGGPGVHIEWARNDARPDGSVSTHGGNTSPGAEGSQDDGGTVAEKVRTAGEIYGRIRIYDLYPGGGGKRPTPKPIDRRDPEPQYVPEAGHGALKIWTTGPRVAELQAALGIADADGYYGRATARRVKEFGQQHDVTTDAGRTASPDLIRTAEQHHPGPAVPRRLLHVGDKGGLVRRLQRALIAGGYLEREAGGHRQDDADYGPNTAAAVHRFKVAKHYTHDSGDITGRRVWKALG